MAGSASSLSPFPPSTSAAGEGHIVARLLPTGEPGLERITYQYPLKLISPPRPAERQSVLVFLLSYGGGLVSGDRVSLTVDVLQGARLSVVTQGHTKVFKSPGGRRDVVTRQELRCRVAGGAALCLLPDPVQPFAESVYEQVQVFSVVDDASLCVLDWVMQGRSARGEDWSFVRWAGRNEVWTSTPTSPPTTRASSGSSAAAVAAGNGGRLLVRDSVILDRDGAQSYTRSLRETMHGHGLFGTLILRGPLTKSLGDFFLAEFVALPRLGGRDFRTQEARQAEEEAISPHERWRAERLRMEREHNVLWSAANVRGCVVVKFGAAAVEAGRSWIGSMIVKEGSIAQHFGEHSLMCIR